MTFFQMAITVPTMNNVVPPRPKQQRSGLGIEAQRAAAQRFAEAEVLLITAEYVEAETGKGPDALERRPQIRAALAAAKAPKCSMLVSKLDRLSRDVAFIAGLMAQRVRKEGLYPKTFDALRTNEINLRSWQRGGVGASASLTDAPPAIAATTQKLTTLKSMPEEAKIGGCYVSEWNGVARTNG